MCPSYTFMKHCFYMLTGICSTSADLMSPTPPNAMFETTQLSVRVLLAVMWQPVPRLHVSSDPSVVCCQATVSDDVTHCSSNTATPPLIRPVKYSYISFPLPFPLPLHSPHIAYETLCV